MGVEGILEIKSGEVEGNLVVKSYYLMENEVSVVVSLSFEKRQGYLFAYPAIMAP